MVELTELKKSYAEDGFWGIQHLAGACWVEEDDCHPSGEMEWGIGCLNHQFSSTSSLKSIGGHSRFEMLCVTELVIFLFKAQGSEEYSPIDPEKEKYLGRGGIKNRIGS